MDDSSATSQIALSLCELYTSDTINIGLMEYNVSDLIFERQKHAKYLGQRCRHACAR